ncbi:bifunctional nuclease 2 isoform X3 [Hevea brasiliensis]|uniref:bifunctional nuclease 2 isoform X3 n=1 Tax=Hevea brasiliensis TaxID=3981 RepID=UPI0025CEFCE2|nr:bifunctional nuclease 2 isoform X3 [Hevea brasiliensis]
MMMLGAQFQVPALDAFRVSRASDGGGGLIPNSGRCLSIQFGLKRSLKLQCRGGRKSILISCNSSRGSSSDGGGQSTNAHDDHDHDFLQASLLISETRIHYLMRRQGFQEEMRWRLPGRWNPFAVLSKESRPEMSFIGHEFLGRFQNPTIFLKVSCDGDFLLPIIVGEFAIEKLVDNILEGDDNGDCPDQFQLVKNLVERIDYEAPILVSKQIVFTDAIRISYGIGDRKPTYDISLDSPADGPDSLSEELYIVKNMNLAIKEQRYVDAAVWRDKLMELRQSRHKE